MRKILVMSAAVFVLVGVYGCGLMDAPVGPHIEVYGNENQVDYRTNEAGDYNQGDQNTGCDSCDGEGGAGNLCSLTSCTDIPDELCVQNGGPKDCQPCANCQATE